MNCELRTQEKCTQIVEELTSHLNQVNNISICIKNKTPIKQIKKKKEKKIVLYGHLGKVFGYKTR